MKRVLAALALLTAALAFTTSCASLGQRQADASSDNSNQGVVLFQRGFR